MATLKHINSKNADYGAAEQYLLFEHDEFTMKPVLDETGRLIPREDYRLSTLNCDGEDFAVACMRANLRYQKNQRREDVKSHHYIISFDPRDGPDNGLTVDRAQALGEQFCKEHFPGHQALVCTHPDGHNHSGNIHVHIVINSLRIEEVPFLPYMDRPADTKAGCKHRCTDAALRYFKSEVMEMCHREGLYQIDLLNGSKNRITDREYWAQKKGQAALDKQNAPMIADGITPRQTKFETNKEKLRQTIRKALATAASFDEFSSKADTNYLYHKTIKENPELASNPLSRFHQKQQIKRQYAKDLRGAGKSAGKAAKKTGKAAGEATKKTTDFIARHWKGILTVGVFLLLIVMIFTGLSSCAAILQGGVSSVLGTSYTAEDEAIREVEADYKELEKDLREEIADIESDYPDYDEYQYHLDEIGHNPFALASYLTAKLYDYTRQEAQAELQALFEKQYTLTLREEIQTRYRTESTTDPDTGETTTEEVPYDYYILHVTLTNKNIETLAGELLTPEQKEMFDIYMETKGNKPDIFGEDYAATPGGGQYTDYEIPPEALSDERFAAMIAEAEKYLGYPYVWGGSSPSTSFDCSGFVCWVINHSGAGSVGRTTAQGIFNYTTPIAPSEAKPGDIIFFTGTYDSGSAVSHVGIYVGNGMMIHCGNPISYASVNTPYWQQHFYAYGRLP